MIYYEKLEENTNHSRKGSYQKDFQNLYQNCIFTDQTCKEPHFLSKASSFSSTVLSSTRWYSPSLLRNTCRICACMYMFSVLLSWCVKSQLLLFCNSYKDNVNSENILSAFIRKEINDGAQRIIATLRVCSHLTKFRPSLIFVPILFCIRRNRHS